MVIVKSFDFLFSAPLVAEIMARPEFFLQGCGARLRRLPLQKKWGVLLFATKRGAENKKAYLTGVQALKPSSTPEISSLS